MITKIRYFNIFQFTSSSTWIGWSSVFRKSKFLADIERTQTTPKSKAEGPLVKISKKNSFQ